MKRFEVAALFLLFVLSSILSGCTTTPPGDHQTDNETLDSRLIGQWRNPRTQEILEFNADGTYTITEGELANWSTAIGGKLWMYGTLYTYTLSENYTLLSITETGYTRTFRKL